MTVYRSTCRHRRTENVSARCGVLTTGWVVRVLGSAPLSSNAATCSSFPSSAAQCKQVHPDASVALTPPGHVCKWFSIARASCCTMSRVGIELTVSPVGLELFSAAAADWLGDIAAATRCGDDIGLVRPRWSTGSGIGGTGRPSLRTEAAKLGPVPWIP